MKVYFYKEEQREMVYVFLSFSSSETRQQKSFKKKRKKIFI